MLVLVQFDAPIRGPDGESYVARVCGRQAEENMWEGWIEFERRDGGPVQRTPRETTQPNLADLEYWAAGLTVAYLEGALERALHPDLPDLRPRDVAATPRYDRPAGSAAGVERMASASAVAPHAVLNPLEVYAQGEDVLRNELSALNEGHLRSIVRAYDFAEDAELDLNALHRQSLIELIVGAARKRAT